MTMHSTSDAWRENGGIIRFSVTSNGRTGEEWITYFESKGIKLTWWVKDVLRSKDFQPTLGITTDIAVLMGEFFTDDARITSFIRAEADKRRLTKPNAEIACLICDLFTNQEIEAMDLNWIVTMHDPINDSDRNPCLLSRSSGCDGPHLTALCGGPDRGWGRDLGFAFAVS